MEESQEDYRHSLSDSDSSNGQEKADNSDKNCYTSNVRIRDTNFYSSTTSQLRTPPMRATTSPGSPQLFRRRCQSVFSSGNLSDTGSFMSLQIPPLSLKSNPDSRIHTPTSFMTQRFSPDFKEIQKSSLFLSNTDFSTEERSSSPDFDRSASRTVTRSKSSKSLFYSSGRLVVDKL